jgi:hypothetical protein
VILYTISRFFCLVLISYDVNIPCSSSMLIESRSTLSYSVDILGSNLIGRYLSTFLTITNSLISSPNPMISFIVSSTHKKQDAIFSSSFIFSCSK